MGRRTICITRNRTEIRAARGREGTPTRRAPVSGDREQAVPRFPPIRSSYPLSTGQHDATETGSLAKRTHTKTGFQQLHIQLLGVTKTRRRVLSHGRIFHACSALPCARIDSSPRISQEDNGRGQKTAPQSG